MIGAFVPQRLVEARVARGLTGVALSELLGVSAGAVSHWESGKYVPRAETLSSLSRTLNVPEWFFRRPSRPSSPEPIFWRSFAYARRAERARCEARFEWLKDVVRYLYDLLEFPPLNLPAIDVVSGLEDYDVRQIERFAAQTREAWGLGDRPIPDTTLMLENNGIVVARSSLGTEALDAFSQWGSHEPRPLIVLGADKSAVRSRLDACHELAHLLLHRQLGPRTVKNGSLIKTIESQAFRFAGALMLPANAFLAELWAPTLDAFRALKERWKVSVGAMIQRAGDLGVVTDEQQRRLWMAYSRRGWRDTEPLDDVIPSETPRLLRRSFEALLEHGLKTRDQIMLDLPYTPRDIESICGLPTGMLDDDAKALPDVVVRQASGVGSVVQFTRKYK